MTALSLFTKCPLGGCVNLTAEPGVPCEECLALFGPRLRPVQPEPVVQQPERRAAPEDQTPGGPGDAVVISRAAGHQARTAWIPAHAKANQLCWLCDQRRKAMPDPDYRDGRLICRPCLEM